MSKRATDGTWRPGRPLGGAKGRGATAEPDVLDNPRSERITRVAGLARRGARTRHGRFVVEGPQGVREAVRCAPERVHDVYLTESAAERHPEIRNEAAGAGLYTHLVTPQVMAAMSEDAQGVLAVVATEEADGADALSALLARLAEPGARPALIAVLTETQDPGNAGTIIRAADAAGADAVLLLRGSVDPQGPKVVRSTAGSLFHLPVITGLRLDEAVSALKGAGIRVLAADGHATTGLFDDGAEALLGRPTAWLLGNEARGLSEGALETADAVVSIPVYGSAESLNVATAATVCLYASARRLRA